MAKTITAEQLAKAEADLVARKDELDVGDGSRAAAMQKLADLRQAFREQEEAAGRREPGHTVVVEEG